jgi:hypothetical protein
MLKDQVIPEQILDCHLQAAGLVRCDFALLAVASEYLLQAGAFEKYVFSLCLDDRFVFCGYNVQIPGCSEHLIHDRFTSLVSRNMLVVAGASEVSRYEVDLSNHSVDGFHWSAPVVGDVILADAGQELWTELEMTVIGHKSFTIFSYTGSGRELRTCSTAVLQLPEDCPWGAERCTGYATGACLVRHIGEWRYHWWRVEAQGYQISCHEQLAQEHVPLRG